MTVTIYQTSAGTRFVRIRELPQALQEGFIRYLRCAAMPVVAGDVGPVAFETDWLDWLHRRHPGREMGHTTTGSQGDESHDNT